MVGFREALDEPSLCDMDVEIVCQGLDTDEAEWVKLDKFKLQWS